MDRVPEPSVGAFLPAETESWFGPGPADDE
jgi:hypothetical protein